MIEVIKPVIGTHDGSSFRELLDLWQENGLCSIKHGPEQRSPGYKDDWDSPEAKCWVGGQGNILLYDFPILDRLQHDYEMCLFANLYKEGEKSKKWIFWPKHPRIMDEKKKELREITKQFKCGFIGTPINLERNSTAQYWSQACDLWHFGGKIDHLQYLENCARMLFGLCLTGVGPKCLRDIEYMAMGVVPIVVNRSAIEFYHNPPIEDEHYIFADNINDLTVKIDNLLSNTNKIKSMSSACIDWFETNCSIHGSFKTTMDIINE